VTVRFPETDLREEISTASAAPALSVQTQDAASPPRRHDAGASPTRIQVTLALTELLNY
jgi:hypothetical protein